MRTIQEHLAETDKTRLLDTLSYHFIEDPMCLTEFKERTIQEIRYWYSGFMNCFISKLLAIDLYCKTRERSRILESIRDLNAPVAEIEQVILCDGGNGHVK